MTDARSVGTSEGAPASSFMSEFCKTMGLPRSSSFANLSMIAFPGNIAPSRIAVVGTADRHLARARPTVRRNRVHFIPAKGLHERWTILGVTLAMFLALRRWKVPVLAIAAWGLTFVLALWWLILILGVIELHRRRQVRHALSATFALDPFPSDGPGDGRDCRTLGYYLPTHTN